MSTRLDLTGAPRGATTHKLGRDAVGIARALAVSCWLIGAVTVIFGASDSSPALMLVGVALMAIGSMGELSTRLRSSFIALPFMLAFCLFLLGRFVAHVIFKYPATDTNRFGLPFNDVQIETHVFGVLALSLAGLQFAFLFLGRGLRPTTHQSKRRRSEAWRGPVRSASLAVFLMSLPLQLYLDFKTGQYVASHGYFQYYISQPSLLPAPVRLLAGAYNISFLIYVATRPAFRPSLYACAAYLLQGVVSLASGQRQGFMLNLFVVGTYLGYRHFMDPDGRVWFSRKLLLAALAAAPVMAVLMVAVGLRRISSTRQVSGLLGNVGDFFYSQGISAEIIGYGYGYAGQMSGTAIYSLGPITNLIFRRIPAIVALGPGVLTGQNAERASESGIFAHFLASKIDSYYYLHGGGYGSAFPAELWADAGMIGVALGSVAVGLVLVALTRGYGGNWVVLALSMAFGREILMMPRSSPTQFLVDTITAPAVLGAILVAFGALVMRPRDPARLRAAA